MDGLPCCCFNLARLLTNGAAFAGARLLASPVAVDATSQSQSPSASASQLTRRRISHINSGNTCVSVRARISHCCAQKRHLYTHRFILTSPCTHSFTRQYTQPGNQSTDQPPTHPPIHPLSVSVVAAQLISHRSHDSFF